MRMECVYGMCKSQLNNNRDMLNIIFEDCKVPKDGKKLKGIHYNILLWREKQKGT